MGRGRQSLQGARYWCTALLLQNNIQLLAQDQASSAVIVRCRLSILSLLLVPAVAAAHGTHQHGVAHVDAAVDAQGIEWTLTADGEGILGFEHAPADAGELAAVARVTEALRAGAGLLALPAAAGCVLETAQVQSPYAAGSAEGGHADWKASFRFSCNTAAAISEIDLGGLFAAFPGLQTVKLQLISAQGQTGADLTPTGPRTAVTAQ
jgi:hypothetical protein